MIGTATHSVPNLPILAVSSSLQSSTSASSQQQSQATVNSSTSSQSPTALSTADNCAQQLGTSQSRQLFNNSSLKIIQRLLDEASQTGELILTGRNLTEFPSKLALVYDLTDTIYAGINILDCLIFFYGL